MKVIIIGLVGIVLGYIIAEYIDYKHLNTKSNTVGGRSWLELIRGRLRLLFGNCPACNSDAPKMYDCPICDFNKNYNNRKKKEDRKYWWNRFVQPRKITH